MNCSMPGFPVLHYLLECHFSSVAQLCLTLQLHGLQHTRLPCPSPSHRACWNSCPLSQWCHPTISSSIIPFSSCRQSFPASGSFLMSQFFSLVSKVLGVSASTWVLPIQDWFPLGLTGLISLQSKELSRVFSNTTVQKRQFFLSGGQSIGVSASTSVLPIQDWFPLGLTSLISLQSKSVLLYWTNNHFSL